MRNLKWHTFGLVSSRRRWVVMMKGERWRVVYLCWKFKEVQLPLLETRKKSNAKMVQMES